MTTMINIIADFEDSYDESKEHSEYEKELFRARRYIYLQTGLESLTLIEYVGLKQILNSCIERGKAQKSLLSYDSFQIGTEAGYIFLERYYGLDGSFSDLPPNYASHLRELVYEKDPVKSATLDDELHKSLVKERILRKKYFARKQEEYHSI